MQNENHQEMDPNLVNRYVAQMRKRQQLKLKGLKLKSQHAADIMMNENHEHSDQQLLNHSVDDRKRKRELALLTWEWEEVIDLVGSDNEQPGDEVVGLLSTDVQESADEAYKVVDVVKNTEDTTTTPEKPNKSSSSPATVKSPRIKNRLYRLCHDHREDDKIILG
ncbi:hypothetical protein LXL04_013017 [Taraxacum kok-saghyz]